MKKLVILSGAGVSKESGINTFRDAGGLWEQYDIEEVASINGWYKNPSLVLEFYNARRRQLQQVEPNLAHTLIVQLEERFDVTVITQNVDNLHERAGSSKVIHLHGELTKARGEHNEEPVIEIGYNDINPGDKAPGGDRLRPHIVWFGEAVPMISIAAEIVAEADILLIIGTSMNVYPAAGLVHYAPNGIPIYLIDPEPIRLSIPNFRQIQKIATEGMREFIELLS